MVCALTTSMLLFYLLHVSAAPLRSASSFGFWQGARRSAYLLSSTKDRQKPRDRNLQATANFDAFERLVSAPAVQAGRLNKSAALAFEKLDLSTFDRERFRSWVRESTLGSISTLSTPPQSFRCSVFYNELYKIIVVRNRKAASSTIIAAIDAALPKSAGKLVRFEPSRLRASGKDATGRQQLAKLWQEYTVISSVRNPWARAASGYGYTFSQWTQKQSSSCRQPSFLQFSRDPMIMGRLSNMMGCAVNRRSSRNDDAWEFDFYHIEPASHCLFEDGKPVVDYLVRYERLDEDVDEVMRLINERRPAGLQALSAASQLPWKKQSKAVRSQIAALSEESITDSISYQSSVPDSSHQDASSNDDHHDDDDDDDEDDDNEDTSSSTGGDTITTESAGCTGRSKEKVSGCAAASAHAAKYRECGVACVRNIGKFYEVDGRLMGFSTPHELKAH